MPHYCAADRSGIAICPPVDRAPNTLPHTVSSDSKKFRTACPHFSPNQSQIESIVSQTETSWIALLSSQLHSRQSRFETVKPIAVAGGAA